MSLSLCRMILLRRKSLLSVFSTDNFVTRDGSVLVNQNKLSKVYFGKLVTSTIMVNV